MNQKELLPIITVFAVLMIGVVFYFFLKTQNRSNEPLIPPPEAPAAGPITVRGEITCLPKRGAGQQTLECAIGLKGSDGLRYGLKNLFKQDANYKFSSPGLRVEVSGIFNPEDIEAPDGNRYDAVGTIDVTSIKEIENGNSQSSIGIIQPEDPEKTGLAPYPDLPLTVPFQKPVSVNFAVEHRSALNGKTVRIRGIIVGTLLGEKACPPDRGMCAQSSIFVADTADKNRNPFYDLRVLVGEEEQEKNYPEGKLIDLDVIIDGNKYSIVARKTY